MYWYREAAEQGRSDAQYNLAVIYSMTTPKNNILAYKWAHLAASADNSQAIKFKDEIAGNMTPAQITKAKRLAAEWKPKKAFIPYQ
ncbi:hypothetical protein [Dethiosulfatarculus sandiegensis]|uniref:hypothetical protein n=1 Tax=Dethiosulfatarculus sandiegensis TaxID=1429043 RepID=UPI0022B205D8|nr:hypothetical protein [Dethiosulfatarculus sandiegensis]